MLPSVEAIVSDFPDFDSPNSFDRSTVMVRVVPVTTISIFFMY